MIFEAVEWCTGLALGASPRALPRPSRRPKLKIPMADSSESEGLKKGQLEYHVSEEPQSNVFWHFERILLCMETELLEIYYCIV